MFAICSLAWDPAQINKSFFILLQPYESRLGWVFIKFIVSMHVYDISSQFKEGLIQFHYLLYKSKIFKTGAVRSATSFSVKLHFSILYFWFLKMLHPLKYEERDKKIWITLHKGLCTVLGLCIASFFFRWLSIVLYITS